MKYKLVTYKTLNGVKKIVKSFKKTSTEWVVYQNDKPKYYVDFFDLRTESNAIMKSLVMRKDRRIEEVLKIINKRNNVDLSIPKVSLLGVRVKSEYTDLELQSIPEEWLSYSL